MKISVLSVASPYRGGIAEQTYYMSQYLADSHDVDIINFKRQYPDFLFPGKTQYESSSKYKSSNCHRLVDTLNPLTWNKAAQFIIKGSPDLILLRFWNPFFAISYSSIIKKVRKAIPSIKVIAVCDNIIPHEKYVFDERLTKLLFSKIDGFIVMSDQVKNELIHIKPNSKYIKLFHPIVFKEQKYDQEEARNKLGIVNDKIILFFGFIREYKGLDVLIRSNKNLYQKLKDYKIIICGESYENKDKYINMISKFSNEDEIKWINEYIPNDMASIYFKASDVIVLPYRSASQSGVIPLSYSYGKPVIASNIPGIKEMIDDKKTGLMFNKEDSNDLSSKVIEFYNSDIDYENNIIDFRNKFSWECFTKGILDFYESL